MKTYSNFIGVNFLMLLVFACLLFLSSFHLIFPPVTIAAMQFSGMVVDQKGQPIEKATVRLQGTSFSTLSDQTGHFEISIDKPVSSKYVTAWKDGYYNGGQLLSPGGAPFRIQLNPIPRDDNRKYAWLPSTYQTSNDGNPEVKPCQKCHAELTEQWSKSTHAGSATNPLFLAFFKGSDLFDGKSAGPGYKLDFPNSNGNCSTCHVPAMALDNPFNSDPRQASGAAREGVSCDFCHKIDAARIDSSGGYPGSLSLQFNRPAEGHQLFYGPYQDVFPGDDSYHPLYRESRYCAPCHNGKFWDVEMYSEFREWAESDYAARKIHCQECHMAPDGIMTRFALEREGSVERRPETIPSHLFYGIGDPAFMKQAIDLQIRAELKDNCLDVTATVANVKAGHHYPTGNPMRNMILLVDASAEDGRSLTLVDGEKVPVWGGVGAVEDGNYAGVPGRGFAKVLRDAISYPDSRGKRHFRPEYPAPHWRPALIESDTRIPANGADTSRYGFRVPADLRGAIRVSARLIYRKSYKSWLDAKGFAADDRELARKNLTVER